MLRRGLYRLYVPELRGLNAGSLGWVRGGWAAKPRPQAVRPKRSTSGHPMVRSFDHLCQRSKGRGGGG
ncbi:hypothetical protein P691DRAFT_350118 [Macrolepiota fuliginosa MF-IS2]|uniref:Uncharacterized protein n=1 Tax=Macrolepiota fuliginosa MF-IS2 TaxID=1400762 RepID=A0A9P5X4A2_9AGAR|nr:hypothetical protein P691DRAFT_350118 [Macrolepiota fuliginosa MF-IS2]